MAIAYRAAPAAGYGYKPSFTVSKQPGTAPRDWIFIAVWANGTGNPVVSSTGFTATSVSSGLPFTLLYRLADGTEGSSFTVSLGSSFYYTYIIATVTGGSPVLDAAGTPNAGGPNTTPAISSITTTANNDWVLWFAGASGGDVGDTITAPPGMTAQATVGYNLTGSSHNPAATLADIEGFTPPGATGTQTGSMPTSMYWAGVMVAVAPAGGVSDLREIRPGPAWLNYFGVYKSFPPVYPSGPNPANQPNPSDTPQIQPGPAWLRGFKPKTLPSGAPPPGVAPVTAPAALPGAGTVTGTGAHAGTGTTTLPGGGTVTGTGAHAGTATTTLPAGGTVTASGAKTATGAAVIQGAAAIITPGTAGTASIAAGAGQVSAAGRKQAAGSAVISGASVSTSAGVHEAAGAGTMPGNSAATATAAKITTGTGRVAAGATITAAAAPVGIVNSWTASYTAPVTPAAGAPLPGPASIPVTVATTTGNWLFTVVAWRQAPGYPPVTFHVGDGVNFWEPVGAPGGTSPAAGTVRVAVWRAAAARAVTTVCAAPTGFALSAAVTVIEVGGLAPWITETGCVTAFTAETTTLGALTLAAPAVPAFWLTASARDLSTPTGTCPAGFTEGPCAATGNGLDHTSDLALLTAFTLTQAAGSVTATWSQTAPSGMAGILCGVLAAAAPPAQPNPGWAPGVLEFAFGAGVSTPADELTWTALDGATVNGCTLTRVQDLQITQGQQYTAGSLQAGQGSVTIDSRDLAVTPPGLGPFTGIDAGTPWRYRITWPGGTAGAPVNPAPHYVLSGYTMDLPTTWNTTRRGVVTAGLTDAWAYCQPQIPSSLRAEILADNPTHCWPCADTAGAAYASNIAPGATAVLVMVTSKYGTAGATAGFGATAALSAAQAAVTTAGLSGLPGEGGTVWAQAGLPASPTLGGYCLYCQDSAFPALSGAAGASIECWSELDGPVPLPQNATLWVIKGTKGLIMRLWADTTGALWLTTQDTAGNQVTASLGSASYAGAGMFQTVVTWLAGAGWTAYVNGVKVAASASPPALAPAFAWISAGGESDRFTSGGMFNGQTTFLATFPQSLPAARVASHWLAGAAAFQGEPDHSRVERLLAYAGYTGKRVIKRSPLPDLTASLADLGTTTASPSTSTGAPIPAGMNSVQAGQEIAATVASLTPALLYVAPAGDIVWLPKGLAFGQAAAWVLGEDTANGEIPYQWDVTLAYDPLRVINLIQVTQVDRQDVVTPQAFTPTAPGFITPAQSARYGQQSYAINGYLFNDLTTPVQAASPASLIDLANWLGVTLAKPHIRGEKIVVDAASYPAAWPFVAGVSPGDVAVLNRRPITAQVTVMLLARVMRVERRIAWQARGAVAQATVTLGYAPELAPLILGDPVAGQLTGTNVLTW